MTTGRSNLAAQRRCSHCDRMIDALRTISGNGYVDSGGNYARRIADEALKADTAVYLEDRLPDPLR